MPFHIFDLVMWPGRLKQSRLYSRDKLVRILLCSEACGRLQAYKTAQDHNMRPRIFNVDPTELLQDQLFMTSYLINLYQTDIKPLHKIASRIRLYMSLPFLCPAKAEGPLQPRRYSGIASDTCGGQTLMHDKLHDTSL